MYQQQKVTIPVSNGGVTVKNIKGTGYVYYTISRVYSPEKKRSNPIRVTIGKQCKDDPTRMFPNEKYAIYFADTLMEELQPDERKSREEIIKLLDTTTRTDEEIKAFLRGENPDEEDE